MEIHEEIENLRNELENDFSSNECFVVLYKDMFNEQDADFLRLVYKQMINHISKGEFRKVYSSIYILELETGYAYEYSRGYNNASITLRKISLNTHKCVSSLYYKEGYQLKTAIKKKFETYYELNDKIGNSLEKKRLNGDLKKEDDFKVELKKYINKEIRMRKIDSLIGTNIK